MSALAQLDRVEIRRTDDDIADDVREAIGRRSGAATMRIDVADGVVTLRGLVLSFTERQDAEQAAWSVPGVREIDDRVVTSR